MFDAAAVPNHNLGLFILAALVMIVIAIAAWWLEPRIIKRYDSYFGDSPISDEDEARRAKFWRNVIDADQRRQQHLDESEASDRNDHQPAV